MCADENGRDISDRLSWQQELYNDLKEKVPLPHIFDLFSENGDTYLAMQFIKGTALQDVIFLLYEDSNWHSLSTKKKLQLLTYLKHILNIIEIIHDNGYIHRDITPVNFILSKSESFFLIDMELAYSIKKDRPQPPFGLGTFGYMSPEQLAMQTPTVKEDLYGLGALMIVFFTNLLPTQFEVTQPEILKEQLLMFINDHSVTSLIVSCMSTDPQKRPEIEFIRQTISSYQDKVTKQHVSQSTAIPKPNQEEIQAIIQKSMETLNSSLLASPEKLWIAGTQQKETTIANQQYARSLHIGIDGGIAGVLYLISRLKRIGFSVTTNIDTYNANLCFIQNRFLSHIPNVLPGLYAGASGVAMALAEGMDSSLVESNHINRQWMQQCLQLVPTSYDVSSGIAGSGISVMSCIPVVGEPFAKSILELQVTQLLESQRKDGLWPQQYVGENKIKYSWMNGAAGIACFLSLSYTLFKEISIEQAVNKSLNSLHKQYQTKATSYRWPQTNADNQVSPWLNEGLAGIALTYLKAYQIFREPQYRKSAENILKRYPKYLTTHLYNYASGLTGIGEVYLEAYRILQNEEWLERAGWIANLILHSYRTDPKGRIYWLTDSSIVPTAGFMKGNSGIIHFLSRYLHMNKISFPFLPFI